MSTQDVNNWARERLTPRRLIALGVILFSLGYVYRSVMGSGRPTLAPGVFYYDLGTRKLFSGRLVDLPPIAAPSGFKSPDGGDGGVRAHVFACGDCKNASAQFIAYLETTTPPVRDLMAQMKELSDKIRAAQSQGPPSPPAPAPGDAPQDVSTETAPATADAPSDMDRLVQLRDEAEKGHLVALPAPDPQWVEMFSEEGNELVRQQLDGKCGEKPPMECRP